MSTTGTAIVTGGSQGIGAGLVTRFLEKDYNVVGNFTRHQQINKLNSNRITQTRMDDQQLDVDHNLNQLFTSFQPNL
jgi:NAD(P)-dependent dehydrogenase (short-subunit alcohol dehydrogenase family)